MQLQTECNYYAEVCLEDTIEVSWGSEMEFEIHHSSRLAGGMRGFPQPLSQFTNCLEHDGKAQKMQLTNAFLAVAQPDVVGELPYPYK